MFDHEPLLTYILPKHNAGDKLPKIPLRRRPTKNDTPTRIKTPLQPLRIRPQRSRHQRLTPAHASRQHMRGQRNFIRSRPRYRRTYRAVHRSDLQLTGPRHRQSLRQLHRRIRPRMVHRFMIKEFRRC